MTILMTILHILVCLLLIAVVLLQTGKRADLAGAFGGGGSQTAFGARGAANALTKMTTAGAILFMITSISLTVMYSTNSGSSVLESIPAAIEDGTDAGSTLDQDVDGLGSDPLDTDPIDIDPVKDDSIDDGSLGSSGDSSTDGID